MKLATFRAAGEVSWGIIQGDHAVNIGAVLRNTYPDLRAALASPDHRDLQAATAQATLYPLNSIEWLPVIPNPPKIICIGLNYTMHVAETGRSTEEHPTIFARYANSQTGHGADILVPKLSAKLDYEGELALIIGRGGRYIVRERAWEHIAGYACYNDASVRDWQRHTSQFTPGKNFPGTGAFGPWMVTRDSIGKIGSQRLQTRLNGNVMQDTTLGEMIFDIPRLIEYCSAFTLLETGDVIATGTPGGVGSRREPPVWLKAGDVVEVEIDEIGTLRNAIKDEK